MGLIIIGLRTKLLFKHVFAVLRMATDAVTQTTKEFRVNSATCVADSVCLF